MTVRPSVQGSTAINYLERFPAVPSRQLARKLFKENPLVFKNFESTYARVRYYRQEMGKKGRRNHPSTAFVRTAEQKKNPYGLPESHSDNWKPMRFPVKNGRGLIIADLHIPYHDIGATTIAMKWGIDNRYTDFVLIDGDLQDCLELSRFQKDPKQRTFKQELNDVNVFLDSLQKHFPKAQIIYKQGNHDIRLNRYLRSKAVELFDMENWIWETALKIKERGIITVEHDVPLYVGKLNIIHGHEIAGASTAVNPARGAYLKAMECILVAHWHRSSMHPETSFSRRLDTAWSAGCLCCLWPEWSRLNKWNHGCAGLTIDGNDFEVDNKRIFQGMIR